MKEEEMTLGKLAQLFETFGRTIMNQITGLQGQTVDLQGQITELKGGLFTVEEKEDLMANVRHINERLENEALGKKDITLLRKEYDATALASGFANRFETPSEVGAE